MISNPVFDTVTTDAIEQRLVELESVVARARGVQVELLRELDVRQVPTVDGCRNLSEWMVSRLDVAPETANGISKLVHSQSHVIDWAVTGGKISVDRAIELTGFDSPDPVAETEHLSIPRLRHHVVTRRRHTRGDERRRHAERFLMMQPSLDQTGLRLWGELVGIDAARFQQVVVDAADQMPALPSGRREPRKARMADALANLVIDTATNDTRDNGPSTMVSVLVDATAATATNGETGSITLSGLRIGPDALEAMLCGGIVELNAHIDEGRYVAVGHTTHTMPPRLRRLIHQRDGGMCTADGCGSRYRLQPHHIRHRHHGGTDDPTNLTLLCWFHHHVVIHRHGHHIDPTSQPGRIRFLPPEPGVDPPA